MATSDHTHSFVWVKDRGPTYRYIGSSGVASSSKKGCDVLGGGTHSECCNDRDAQGMQYISFGIRIVTGRRPGRSPSAAKCMMVYEHILQGDLADTVLVRKSQPGRRARATARCSIVLPRRLVVVAAHHILRRIQPQRNTPAKRSLPWSTAPPREIHAAA